MLNAAVRSSATSTVRRVGFFIEMPAAVFVGDRRQCNACRVLRPNAMLRMVERDVCQYSDNMSFSSVLAAGHCRQMVRQFLPIFLSSPGFRIGMVIASCHTSGISPVEIGRLKILVR